MRGIGTNGDAVTEEQQGKAAQNKSAQNKSALTRDEVLAALPGYVLDALDPAEKRAVEEYLRQHPELAPRVRDLDAAGAALAESAPVVPLRAETKQAVLARVRADVQTDRPRIAPRGKRVQAAAQPAAPAGTVPAAPAPAAGDSLGQRMRRWWTERRYAGLSLGLATALGILLLVVLLQNQSLVEQNRTGLAAVQARVDSLEADNAQLRAQNEILQAAVTQQRQQWATILAADAAIALAGTDDALAAEAVLYADDDQLLVVARDLPPLTPEQTYQLWLIPADGAPVPAGLFQASDGLAVFQSDAPLPRTAYASVGVSIEPAGGSSAPTGPIVLLGATS